MERADSATCALLRAQSGIARRIFDYLRPRRCSAGQTKSAEKYGQLDKGFSATAGALDPIGVLDDHARAEEANAPSHNAATDAASDPRSHTQRTQLPDFPILRGISRGKNPKASLIRILFQFRTNL